MSKQLASSSKLNMSVESRGNGFRKVAKWALGIAAVISATNGIVEAKDEEMPRKVTVERNPDDVVIVTSRGKKYTNQDIEDLIDKKISCIQATMWFDKAKYEHLKAFTLKRRREDMRSEIRKFDELVNELPESLANKLGEYPTQAHLPKELADELNAYLEKQRVIHASMKLPEALARKVSECSSMDDIPADIKDQVDWHLANYRFNGLLEEIPKELAMEVAKYHSHPEIPRKLMDEIHRKTKTKYFHDFVKTLPTDLAQQAEQYSSFDELPESIAGEIRKHFEKKEIDRIFKKLPEDLAQQARQYPTIDDIPEDLLAKMESHLGMVLRHRGTHESTDETNISKENETSPNDIESNNEAEESV